MPTELEAKFKVDTHDGVRQRLRDAQAEPLGRVLETNRIFDDASRSLLASGRGLRVRHCAALDGRADRGTVTYKGPQAPGRLKSREEIEFATDDPAAAAGLLERIGYHPVIVFQKRRESWRLGTCLIELDEVVHLGLFVEIEGPDEAAIAAAQRDLGLAQATHIRESYVALLADYAKRHGLDLKAMMF